MKGKKIMAFCKNCGQELAQDAAVCPNCGTAAEAPVVEQAAPAVEQAAPVDYEVAPEASAVVNEDADVKENKGISILSYFGILLLIPLFVKKASEYCKFHVKQGANLFVIELAYAIATNILLAIIGLIFRPVTHSYYLLVYSTPHPVYSIFSVIFSLGYIFFLVIAILGMVNAGTGKKKDMPILGGFKFMDSVMDKIYDSLNK